jgi:hypothetical protein
MRRRQVGFCYSSCIFFIPKALVSVSGTLVLLGAAVSKNVHRNVLFQLLRRKRLHEYRIYNKLNTVRFQSKNVVAPSKLTCTRRWTVRQNKFFDKSG